MEAQRERIIRRYRGKGFKLTPQRIAILEFLEGNTDHPSADDIYQAIRLTHPTVSIATVYNTVETLRDKGFIIEITIDPERKHYDPNANRHHHIICTDCAKIGDIFEDYSETLNLPIEMMREFTLTGNHINFYGLCRDCIDLN
ncbi:MAG: transcriptional repressor [Thermodesulfobacteriota bacterium]